MLWLGLQRLCGMLEENKLTCDLRSLHEEIINKIISFCRKHNLIIDEVGLSADGLKDSISFGSWHPSTDSSLVFYLEKEPLIFSM